MMSIILSPLTHNTTGPLSGTADSLPGQHMKPHSLPPYPKAQGLCHFGWHKAVMLRVLKCPAAVITVENNEITLILSPTKLAPLEVS